MIPLATLLPILRRIWSYALAVALALGLWHYRGEWQAEKAGRASDKALYTTAQQVADAEWSAKLAKAKADYDAKAAQGDKDHEQLSRDYAALAADYKQRMRIQAPKGYAGHVQAIADSHGASVPQAAPAAPLVAITDADIDACTAAVAYGDAAHAWALSLDGVR